MYSAYILLIICALHQYNYGKISAATSAHNSTTKSKQAEKFFSHVLDINSDGMVNWIDFESVIESIVSKDEASKNARLKVLRKRLEQHFQKFFWELLKVGDSNQDGDIDLNEWLNVLDDVVNDLKKTNEFPDWFEDLFKSLWRANEFFNEKAVLKDEFANMLIAWDIDENTAGKLYDFITENGKKAMDYHLFAILMKKFFLNEIPNHILNLGRA
ncbi:unnamed protein product [Adineta ricciae]|uniref:EF-hand domain-containing protein n=1 Tax=Adineta ricciae TaxID=249248 RepID=A0A814TEN1_ADIRI|nr:unnamed protein product [Adineta ricciae]